MIRTLDRADIDRFRTVIAERLGLQCEVGKIEHLADLLHHRMSIVGSPDFGAYVDGLCDSSTDELRVLAQDLTVTETFFFRNADHFRACAEVVLPERIRVRRGEKRLRILSAGCASGEEAYSLAVLVREAIPDLAAWDVRIIGLDINRSMLTKAAQARYSAWSLRATPDQSKARYFRQDGTRFLLDPAIQKMVTFEEHNLVDDDPRFWHAFSCDLIFCRNVIMYFTPEVMRAVVQRLSRAVMPGGFLFLGHAETLRGLAQGFHLCHTHDTFYYQHGDTSALPTHRLETRRVSGPAGLAGPVVDDDASWVDVIRRASERVTSLTNGRRHHPPSEAASPATLATRHATPTELGRVLDALRRERFADALELLSALPAAAQDDVDALLLRAALLTHGGRLEDAEHACRRLLAIDELNAGAHYVMALCREHAADRAGAIEHDQAAIYLDESFAMPHLHLGLLAKRSGDVATAEHELDQALALLGREDAARLLLFGGGFSRDTLLQLCRSELRTVGTAP